MSEYFFNLPPPPAGYYALGGGFKIAMTRKPRWLHRVMMSWCFGWAWEDAA